MRVHFIFAIVVVQILIFQFVSLRFLKAIPDFLFGSTGLPDDVRQAVEAYRRAIQQWSYPVGLGLLVGMTLCAYVLPFTRGVPGLLAITAASILSSGFFAWTYLRARSAAEKITEMLPDSGKRVASLERRSLGHYYNVAWEFLPFVLFAASAVLTLWALPKLGQPYPLGFDARGIPNEWGEGTGRFFTILFLQGGCAFGLLFITFWSLRSLPWLSTRAPVASRDPERAGRLSEVVRGRKLRLLMTAKVALAVQFALILFVKIETALGVVLPAWVRGSPWAATAFLLMLFVAFTVQIARDRKLAL